MIALFFDFLSSLCHSTLICFPVQANSLFVSSFEGCLLVYLGRRSFSFLMLVICFIIFVFSVRFQLYCLNLFASFSAQDILNEVIPSNHVAEYEDKLAVSNLSYAFFLIILFILDFIIKVNRSAYKTKYLTNRTKFASLLVSIIF